MSELKKLIEITNDMSNGNMESWEAWKQQIKQEFREDFDNTKDSFWFSCN